MSCRVTYECAHDVASAQVWQKVFDNVDIEIVSLSSLLAVVKLVHC